MNFKKILIVIMISVLFVSGCGTNPLGTPLGSFEDKEIRIGLITDLEGTGSSYYSKVWDGLLKAEKDQGVGIAYLKAKDEKEYTARLKEFNKHNADLILTFGDISVPAVLEAAKANSKTTYIVIDASTEEAIPDNVLVISYKEEEAAFLAGYIAGKMTKSNVIGFITGRNDQISERYYFGYKAGVRSANPNCELMKGIAATSTNTNRVATMTQRMLESKADVIFHIAGIAGNGMIKAVDKAGKYAIGSMVDQRLIAPNSVLSSVVKNNDIVVFELVTQYKEGILTLGEKTRYGLAQNAVGLSESTKEMIPEALYNSIIEYEEQIISDKIEIPNNENDYHKFVIN